MTAAYAQQICPATLSQAPQAASLTQIECRGLSTALVEGEDFAAGTSSKSTKLVHGGVRYLEKAVFNFDTGQLKLVFEALHERRHFLQNAPHLCDSLPIMTVCPVGLVCALAAYSARQAADPLSYCDSAVLSIC